MTQSTSSRSITPPSDVAQSTPSSAARTFNRSATAGTSTRAFSSTSGTRPQSSALMRRAAMRPSAPATAIRNFPTTSLRFVGDADLDGLLRLLFEQREGVGGLGEGQDRVKQ